MEDQAPALQSAAGVQNEDVRCGSEMDWWSGLSDEDGVGPEGAFLSYYRRQRLCESREAWEQSEVSPQALIARSRGLKRLERRK